MPGSDGLRLVLHSRAALHALAELASDITVPDTVDLPYAVPASIPGTIAAAPMTFFDPADNTPLVGVVATPALHPRALPAVLTPIAELGSVRRLLPVLAIIALLSRP